MWSDVAAHRLSEDDAEALLEQRRMVANRADRRSGRVDGSRVPTQDDVRALGVVARARVKALEHGRLVSVALREFTARQAVESTRERGVTVVSADVAAVSVRPTEPATPAAGGERP